MKHEVRFNSERYQETQWVSILKRCFDGENTYPTVLNNHGLSLIPNHYLDYQMIRIQTPREEQIFQISEFNFVEHLFLSDCDIQVAQLPKRTLLFSENNIYLNLCLEICIQSVMVVKSILTYLCDHLANRESENIKLIQHETIRLSIAKIVTLIESAKKLLSVATNTESLAVAIDFLLEATQRLSELGGGRSLLRGNATELMFHLIVFKTLFLKNEGEKG